MKKLKTNRIDKQKLAQYVEAHKISYTNNNDYKLALISHEKGLYSGIVELEGSKYYDFIIDFPNHDVTIKGLQGRKLKMNVTLLNKIFNYGRFYNRSKDPELDLFLSMLKELGTLLGSIDDESDNVGRGLIRALNNFSMAEQVVKDAILSKTHVSYGNLAAILGIVEEAYKANHKTSPRKVLGMSTKEYQKLFSKPKSLLGNNTSAHVYSNEYDGKGKVYIQVSTNLIRDAHRYEAEIGSDNIVELLKAISQRYEATKIVTRESINDLCQQVDDVRGYQEASTVADRIYEDAFTGYSHDIITLMEQLGGITYTNLKHLVTYLYASCYHQQALNAGESLGILHDYYSMVNDIPHFNKYPRYLKTAHDIAIKNIHEEDTKASRLAVLKQYLNYKDLEMAFDDYVVILAASPKEIVSEGVQAGNCVGGYVSYVSKKRSLILFLRKKDEPLKSMITFELSLSSKGLELVQAYDKYDTKLSEEKQSLLASYCAKKNISWNSNIGGAVTKAWNNMVEPIRSKEMDFDLVHKEALVNMDALNKQLEQEKEQTKTEINAIPIAV